MSARRSSGYPRSAAQDGQRKQQCAATEAEHGDIPDLQLAHDAEACHGEPAREDGDRQRRMDESDEARLGDPRRVGSRSVAAIADASPLAIGQAARSGLKVARIASGSSRLR
jgi:hypothetical protein